MPRLSDAERQAKREADRQRAREAVEALRSTEGWKGWLRCRRFFHTYSLANQLLIAMQCPHATRVAGFRAWLKLGYCVRRGETALRIWVPMPPSKRALEQWTAEGADPQQQPLTRFRLGPVFDRSQVEPLPAPATPMPLDPPITQLEGNDLAWAFPVLVRLASELGSAVVIEPIPGGAGGFFEPASRRIALSQDNSVNQQVKTLVHELGHALLRAEGEQAELPFTYSEEELVVESIAFTVCGSVGIDTASYSIPYLASWSERAGMDIIEVAAQAIDRIAKRIEVPLHEAQSTTEITPV